jgi:hypothetical protein
MPFESIYVIYRVCKVLCIGLNYQIELSTSYGRAVDCCVMVVVLVVST